MKFAKDKIYKNEKEGAREEMSLEGEILSIYKDGNSAIVVSKTGKIYKF